MNNTVWIVCFFTLIINMTESLALSMRLAGVRTKQIATSISFVNVSFLISRMSNMLQAPLLGAMVDSSVRLGTANSLIDSFRVIIFSGFIGNLIGAALTPTMVGVFEQGIYIFEKKGSIPSLIKAALTPRNLWKIIKMFRLPHLRDFQKIKWHTIPHTFLYLNVCMAAIYAVGVLASLLAGAFLPDYRATTGQLSGIVNGMATILLAIMVDPTGAHITDQAARGKRPIDDVRSMVFFLLLGKLIAFLLIAQFLLVPATHYIMYVARQISTAFGG